jgi:hypothetical protein
LMPLGTKGSMTPFRKSATPTRSASEEDVRETLAIPVPRLRFGLI